MNYWGRILGTLFGFMFARIWGAALGFAVGYFFDRGYSQDFNQMGGFGRFFVDKDSVKNQAVFFHALFSVLGHLAKADGRVTEEEIKVATQLMDDMKLTGDIRKEAQQAYREGKSADFPVRDILKAFHESCYGRRDVLQIYLEILIQAAYADGRLDAKEQKVLIDVAHCLGFQKQELLYLVSAFEAELRFRQTSQQKQHTNHQQKQGRGWRPNTERKRQRARDQQQDDNTGDNNAQDDFDEEAYYDKQREQYSDNNYQKSKRWQHNQTYQYSQADRLGDAYRILGVTTAADAKTVKKAYRKLMNEHHPDKLISKGLPKQALDIAKQKAQDIQAAYELVKKDKGF